MNARIDSPFRSCWLPIIAAVFLAGCAATVPKDALRLPESTLEVRSIQTRTFSAASENEILAATIALLQDMEYNIEQIEKPLGVITASKTTDAAPSTGEQGKLMLFVIMCLLSGGGCDVMSSATDEQRIDVTLVVLPSLARRGEYAARVTIQRTVYDEAARIKKLERIDDAEIYQQIFDNLAKSIFIQVSSND